MLETGGMLAGATGLEPAASGVTGSYGVSSEIVMFIRLRKSSGGKLPSHDLNSRPERAGVRILGAGGITLNVSPLLRRGAGTCP
jgi:hypothetical protein